MSILNKSIWDRLNQHNNSQPLTAATDKKLVGMESSPLKVLGTVHFHVIFEQYDFLAARGDSGQRSPERQSLCN